MTTIALTTCSAGPIRRPGTANFAVESELGPAVHAWLGAGRDVAAVVDEIDAGTGIADVVAAHAENPYQPRRAAIADPVQLRVLELTQGPTPEAALRAWAPQGWRSLRTHVINLIHAGQLATHLGSSEDGHPEPSYIATVDTTDPYSYLTAVELKLRDWRRAIAQAGRYRLWAERSYVALPADRVNNAVIAEAARNRVGVLAVHGSAECAWVTAELDSPTAAAIQPQRRRWASEQVLAEVREPSSRPAGAPIT